ncbi:hypothetical protein AJ78_00506 [Emergomyces pasteurianus Ep9510]|uniref:N-acetyltransferase domain-containing protein n=1 Tax=Emergomyces pasteurianus Ep9510 TaxID=1447872 RepID=A0A1J9QTK6_9EURO|nr:hypothetical protein AJ78_00506 [Emergomyces pasteurianus Ep9510]
MHTPTLHVHHQPKTSLLPLLSTHFPYSGPLFRRIQHSLIYPSETAQILATFPPALASTSFKPLSPWLVAYVDIYAGNDTQIWLYSSVEAEASIPSTQQRSSTKEQLSDTDQLTKLALEPVIAAEIQAQLLSLCSYIRTHLIPPYILYLESQSKGLGQTTSSVPQIPFPGSVQKIPPHPPASFKIGTMHTGIYDLLKVMMEAPEEIPSHLPKIRILPLDTGICMKYLFRRSAYDPFQENPTGASSRNTENVSDLPQGYRFHDINHCVGVQSRHLDLVISRTDIPRSKELLEKLPSVALYYDGGSNNMTSSGPDATVHEPSGCASGDMPIAWAFLGLDGSLCSLHVEEEHRRRGLAKIIAREVMKSGMEADGGVFTYGPGSDGATMGKGKDYDQGWVFADVVLRNKPSRNVMGKLGGQPAWTIKWVVVEVL